MNLEDLAKKTIDELHSQIKEQKPEFEMPKDEPEIIDLNAYEEKMNALMQEEQQEQIEVLSALNDEQNNALSFNDELFLKNIRERILVLFEGLNSVDKNALESRLDLTINFLEFLLAKIEDKLKK